VRRVHTPDYVRRIKAGAFSPAELRLLEVPWSPGLVEGVWLAAGAAIEAGRLARRDGCAIVLGGGFHHAFPDHGEGFCLVHDVAVATAALRAAGDVGRVAVVDLDVHQGNGTAAIFAGDPDTFTVSLHQESNYPVVLGGLALTREGLRERDRRVFAAARSAGVPVAVTLAGGYASSPSDTVSIHVGTVLAGADVHARARDGLSASRH
jgi:acetoin utilization deacetylase AcuC-like enzyme